MKSIPFWKLLIFLFGVAIQTAPAQGISNFNPRSTEIGGLIWMTDNLDIPHREAVCYKGYTKNGVHRTAESMCRTHGRLYTIKAATELARRIEGWHLPTDEEWKIMEQAMGMSAYEANQTEWRGAGIADKVKQGSYDSDFRILMDGGSVGNRGNFSDYPEYTYYWAGDQAKVGQYWCRGFLSTSNKIYRGHQYNNYKNRYYVRLVKDYEGQSTSGETSSAATISSTELKVLEKEVARTDKSVHSAFFSHGELNKKYQQFYTSSVEVLVKTLKCSATTVTSDYDKAQYYKYIIAVNKRILQVLNDPSRVKKIGKSLEGMTTAEGDPGIVEKYLHLSRPNNLNGRFCRD